MSGLAAIARFDGRGVEAAQLRSMLDAVGFRGPLGIESWSDTDAALGVLVSGGATGSGPFVAPDVVVAADCRLDNRPELIERLRSAGEPSDARLVADAYRRWGDRFPAELLGDFALVVWDRNRHRLLLARDAMGMRPLHFHLAPGRLILVATEVAQIVHVPDVTAVPDRDSMIAHLLERETRLDRSYLAGVDQVAPGQIVIVNEDGRMRRSQFWEPDPECRIALADTEEYAEALRELLIEAVRTRCAGVGPTGLMLSGGVDSGAIAVTAGWLKSQGAIGALHTYSWMSQRFPEVDERAVSDTLTKHWGLPATAVSIDDALPLSGWPQIAPFIDDAQHGVFTEGLLALLDAAAADGMETMMSGDRGDLMTAGWVLRYPSLLRARKFRALGHEIFEQRSERGDSLSRIVSRDVLVAGWRTIRRRFSAGPVPATAEAGSWILERRIHDEESPFDVGSVDRPGYSWIRRLELIGATAVTRNIAWTDRLHARAGLGFADPWSDRRIAEFVLAIPQQQLLGPGEIDEKRLARLAIAPFLPEDPYPPLAKCPPGVVFRAGLEAAAPEILGRLFTGSRCAQAGLIDDERFRTAVKAFLDGGRTPLGFWPTISLEMWLRSHWP